MFNYLALSKIATIYQNRLQKYKLASDFESAFGHWIFPNGEKKEVYSHREYARKYLLVKILEILGLPKKKIDHFPLLDNFVEEFFGPLTLEQIEEKLMNYWQDGKAVKNALYSAMGDNYTYGSAEYFVIRYEGWIREHSDNFECYGLTASAMKNIADNTRKVYLINDLQNGAAYYDVPLDVLSSGKLRELRDYRR